MFSNKNKDNTWYRLLHFQAWSPARNHVWMLPYPSQQHPVPSEEPLKTVIRKRMLATVLVIIELSEINLHMNMQDAAHKQLGILYKERVEPDLSCLRQWLHEIQHPLASDKINNFHCLCPRYVNKACSWTSSGEANLAIIIDIMEIISSLLNIRCKIFWWNPWFLAVITNKNLTPWFQPLKKAFEQWWFILKKQPNLSTINLIAF